MYYFVFKFERFVLTDTVTNNLTSSTKPKGPEEHKLPYIADTSNFLESFTIQPNFDCFQTHGFHKLMLKKKQKIALAFFTQINVPCTQILKIWNANKEFRTQF